MTNYQMAPGHAISATDPKTGVEWLPQQVNLWEYDASKKAPVITRTGKSFGINAWDYFHQALYVQSFPLITHWWFGSPWTQRVKITYPLGQGSDVDGWIVYTDDACRLPFQYWGRRRPGSVSLSLPPGETMVNLPLYIALSRLIIGCLADEVERDHWINITSLVPAERAALAVPHGPLVMDEERHWCMEQLPLDGTRSMRDWWLQEQGITRPHA